jgi:S-adenosylmethionine:tRNA ribosyltransferase-isomerase
LNDLGDNIWEALIRPGKRVKEGRAIYFDPRLSAVVEAKMDGGRVRLKLTADGDTFNVLETVGKTPLPPYIKRENTENDRARYQTVYARNQGAVAAPTAGLHFTDEILDQVRERNVEIVEITLHVGYGTFEPVRVDDLSLHTVRPERVTIDDTAAVILNTAKSAGRRIIAVGTTVTRALEWNFSRKGRFTATEASEEADLTVRPGYEFKAIDALLTNFHLPKSSLLVLVSTFGGHELIMRAYEHAVAERYRFYSYGDCMFVG